MNKQELCHRFGFNPHETPLLPQQDPVKGKPFDRNGRWPHFRKATVERKPLDGNISDDALVLQLCEDLGFPGKPRKIVEQYHVDIGADRWTVPKRLGKGSSVVEVRICYVVYLREGSQRSLVDEAWAGLSESHRVIGLDLLSELSHYTLPD